MLKISFSTIINAPKEKVWEVLWDMDAYKAWTKTFAEGSHVKTDNWKEGSKVLFLGPNNDGMVSTVAANRPNEYMSFKHLGMVKSGMEDTTSDEVKPWAGSMENYSLKDVNGQTELSIDMDITEEYKDMFEKMWPNALAIVKELAEGTAKTTITIEAEVNAHVEKVWNCWTKPEHIVQWNQASNDWHCPKAENNVSAGGKFTFTMAAKDGSFSFDFGGIHDEVALYQTIASTMEDGRKMRVLFEAKGEKTKIVESFEAENENLLELQRMGWQSILNSFKKHTETVQYFFMQKIYPCLWFDGKGREAAEWYCSVFENSKIVTDSGMVVMFELNGKKFMALNGGTMFKINPSISFFVLCKSAEEADTKWKK